MKRRQVTLGFAGLLAGATLRTSHAQGPAPWPAKPITLVASFAGMTDQMGRVLAEAITAKTGHAVVVEARPGASGIVAAEYVLKAPPDGHVLFHTTNTTHAANQSLFKSLPYDYVRDFIPITGVLRGGLMLACDYTQDERRAQFRAEFAGAIKGLNLNDQRARASGSKPVTRPRVVV